MFWTRWDSQMYILKKLQHIKRLVVDWKLAVRYAVSPRSWGKIITVTTPPAGMVKLNVDGTEQGWIWWPYS